MGRQGRRFTAQKSRGWLVKVGRKKRGLLEEGLKGSSVLHATRFYRVKPSWDMKSNLTGI